MGKKLVHTPEGVRDIYGDEKEKKTIVERLLHERITAYGYRDIQTPTFEFFDVFSKEVGTTPSRELYKFFDKEGNTLVLRPDFYAVHCQVRRKILYGRECADPFLLSGKHLYEHFRFTGKIKGSDPDGSGVNRRRFRAGGRGDDRHDD